MSEFDGLVAVVTGAASGIGSEIAVLLAQRGAAVALLDRAPARTVPGGCVAVRCDVSSAESVASAIHQAGSRFGQIDIVVNSAGIGAQGTVEQFSDDEWRELFDVNVLGVARVSGAAMPYLRSSGHAAIVNVSSVVAQVGVPQRAAYSASKGAVAALTAAMAADHLADGIRVNCVAPGTTDTPWIGRLLNASVEPDAERQALIARQPMGRLVAPAEVADAVAYLASPRSASTTGTTLTVDGGLSGLRLPQRTNQGG